MSTIEVKYIFGGNIKPYKIKEKKFESAYLKKEEFQTIFITKDGIVTDQQADRRYHGGEDKALLIASTNHFKTYEDEFQESIDKAIFSANIFVNTLDESTVCVGDIYKLGEVLVQVTQPRQPCWKIGAVFSNKISKFIKVHSATGWYVKVLQEGSISQNDNVELVKKQSSISIKDMSKFLNEKTIDKEILKTLINADFVAQSYKNDISKIVENDKR